MSVAVQDCKGHEIRVGTHVTYGVDSPGVVTAISDPDIAYGPDDEYGREQVRGPVVVITVRLNDGPNVEADAASITSQGELYAAQMDDREAEELYEEPGDVVVDPYRRLVHVARSAVWAGSRSGGNGRTHLHVQYETTIGRIHRVPGRALCGRRGWYERAVEFPGEWDDICTRCAEIAARVAPEVLS